MDPLQKGMHIIMTPMIHIIPLGYPGVHDLGMITESNGMVVKPHLKLHQIRTTCHYAELQFITYFPSIHVNIHIRTYMEILYIHTN